MNGEGATGTPEYLCLSGKGVTIRSNTALACMLRLHIYQMDVSSAFCYADIAGDVYVGTTDEEEVKSGRCYNLQKSLYGLWSSPR